jgi:hypothetical protein
MTDYVRYVAYFFYTDRSHLSVQSVLQLSIPFDATPLQCLQQLRSSSQTLLGFFVAHPAPDPFMALGPDVLLLVDQAVKEFVRSLRRVLAVLFDLGLAAHLRDRSQVSFDGHVDARFFPSFAGRSFDFAFIGFPAAFG